MFITVKTIAKQILEHSKKFEMKIKKSSLCTSSSLGDAEFGYFTFLLSKGQQRNVPGITTQADSHCYVVFIKSFIQ